VGHLGEVTAAAPEQDRVGAGAEGEVPAVGVLELDLVIARTADDHSWRAEAVLGGHLRDDRDGLVPSGVREVARGASRVVQPFLGVIQM